MRNLKNTSIVTSESQISITNASVDASEAEYRGKILGMLTFTLALDGVSYGEYTLVLNEDLHVDDVYLDCGKYLPETEDLEVIESLNQYAESVRSLYDAERDGEANHGTMTLYTAEAIMEEQKTWNELDESKNFDFSTASFWLIAAPDGIQGVEWSDISDLIEALS